MSARDDCRRIEDLLDRYVLGTLDARELENVEAHLAQCGDCRERVEFTRSLAEVVKSRELEGSGYHLSTQVIVGLAQGARLLPASVAREARDHIRKCPRCKELVDLAAKAARELEIERPEGAGATWRRELLGSLAGGIRKLFTRRLAPAWGVAAALLVVLGWLYLSGRESRMDVLEVPSQTQMEITQEAIPPGPAIEPPPSGWEAWPPIVAEAERAVAGGDTDLALALTDSAWHVATMAYSESTGRYSSGSLRDSVMTLFYFNDYAQAESLLTRIRRVREKALGPDHPDLALDWHDLAMLYGRQWRHSESVPFYQRTLEIRENALAPLHPDVAQSVMNLAQHYNHLGRYDEAEPLLRRAFDLREQIYGPHLYESFKAADLLAKVRDELAHLYVRTGRYAEAERLYRESLEIRRVMIADSRPAELGASYAYLGNLYWTLGEQSRAESLYSRALALQIKEHGPNHPEVATGLSQLAMVNAARGNYEEAEALYKQALEIREATVAKDTPGGAHPGIAMSCHSLASLYTEMGRYEEAEPYYKRALDVWNQAFGFEHPRSVSTMSDYAYNCLEMGEYEQAEALYARALNVAEDTYGPLNPNVASVLESMCLLYRKEGRYEQAIDLAARAVEARSANFSENAPFLAENDALIFAHQLNRSVANYVSCFMDAGAPPEHASETVDLILANKGPVSDEIFERQQSLFEDGGPEARSLAEGLKDTRFQLAQLYRTGPGQDAGAYASRIDSLENLASGIEVRLAAVSSVYRKRHEPDEVTARSLAAMLPRNATLIDYFRYDYMDAETEERTPMYAAVVLRKGRPARLFDLGEASPIDEHVDDYRQHMADVDYEGGKPSAVDVARYEEISASLYESIWRPIAETVGDAEMIIVAPDGALNMLAFGALEGESGDYLIESAMFHYLTSSRDLVRLNERFSAGTGLLAMGDPEYEPPEGRPAPPESSQDQEPVQVAWAAPAQASRGMYPTCDLFMNQRPAPLPGTRKEIETAADSWRKHSTEPAAVYLGKDASEAHFKHEAPGKRVIYLAAHGYLLGSSCASEASHRFGMEERYFARANPLLLSGLYLAGADETLDGKLEPGGEDGILTAYEVSGLDLRKSHLVILSACNTALGRIEEGEGTYGLRRAFQMAGARTVVSTLWPIPDEATSEMMGALYMSEDEPVAKALHRVQMDRLKALRARGESDHPYSWAAFIATGDWR